jgi:AcrR family transcriptional regulator
MIQAAMDLYAEQGFERTTVGDIAHRAGVTERTYFRHFPDKREVLFDPSHALEHAAVDATTGAAPAAEALAAALVGATAAAAMLDGLGDRARVRAGIIDADQSLQERELLKLAALTDAMAAALQTRGVAPGPAATAAQTAVGLFQVAFRRWVDAPTGPPITAHLSDAAAELAALHP